MENQAEQTNQSPATNVVDLQTPDRKVTRRKFVQTTLFPLKPHDTKVEDCSKLEPKKGDEIPGGNDDKEYCESQGGKNKRGRKPKGNTTPRKRGSNKANDMKLENCIQNEVKKVEEIIGDNIDVEVCGSQGKRKGERNLKGTTTPQKRGCKKAAVNGINASDDIELPDDGSPQQLKGKQRASTRNGRTNGNKTPSKSKVSTQSVSTQQFSQAVPDLWLEAKMTAEENSRIFAGKQIHPFFSSWKTGKKELEAIDVENYEGLGKRKQNNVEIGPIHVFENDKDDLDYIDWSSWSFNDGIFNSIAYNEERDISSFKVSLGALAFDDITSASNPCSTSLLLKNVSMSQLCAANDVISTSISPIVVDEGEPPDDPLKNVKRDFEVREPFTYGNTGSHFEQQNAVLQERITSYYFNRGNYPDNSLWTNKYHPRKALEVCGNSEAVKFINDWLHLWHGTDFRFSKTFYSADSCSMEDDSYDTDSDVRDEEEASGLKNVLLVTGPVGSGKSAAIYACAKEQGFQVIEVNASDWRNGALLKQKIGEALGSHWVKRSQESPMGKRNLKSSPIFINEAAPQDLNKGVNEVISLLEKEDYVGDFGTLSCDKGDIKTLILFEDVDVNLCDDRGFISTIHQLADTGKRPMILTSNNESPPLPNSLDREEVCFTMPSLKELAHHILLVCSAEKSNTKANLIERCVEFCRGDIRKTMMLLQFWCQSKECMNDGKLRSEFCPLIFNLDAGHCILPKLMPWELPSLLSEFVEAEVAKSFSTMEEHYRVLGVIEEEELGNTGNKLDFDIGETAGIEAKKEAILNGNYFVHVDNDIMAGSNTCELSKSCSPVAFTRRNTRRKADTVLSESEDEICNYDNSAVSDSLSGDNATAMVPAVHPQSPALYLASKEISNDVCEQLLRSEAKEVEVVRHQASETALNLVNFFSLGTSCNLSTDPVSHSSEANPECQEFAHANCSGCGEANDSVNLLNDLLVHTRDGTIEVNMHQFSEEDHEKFPSIGNWNQSASQSFRFEEANGVKAGRGNATNLCLNPLSNHLQHNGEEKIAAKRCLFPDPAQADPVIGSPRNQSMGQVIQRVEASMTEPPQWHLDIGTVDRDGPIYDNLLSFTKVDMEGSKQPPTEDANPLCYTALSDSLNPSNDQLFQFIQGKEEIQHQHIEASDRSDKSCTAMGVPFNQSSDQGLGIDLSVNSQHQLPQIADLNNASCLQIDAPLSLISEQFHCKEEEAAIDEQKLPEMAISCPAAENPLNPLDGKILTFTESKAEQHQCQFTDASNVDHAIDQCNSLDLSVVPESTFVSETEVLDGTECPSGNDLMDILSPVVIGNGEPSIRGFQAAERRFFVTDLNENPRDEEMGDTQTENECLEPSTSGCPVMDECSRIDFFKRSKSFRTPALEIKNSVQKKWNELRKTDLREYSLSENKNALQLVELGYRMSNLISEGDLLLNDSELLTNDLSDPGEETFAFGWLDQHVQMASSIAQYGYLLYVKDIDALQSKMGLANKLHLSWEMLVSTSDSTALGKLLSLNRSPISLAEMSLKQAAKTIDIESTREKETCLQNIVQSVVPLRSFLAVRGNALHDYLFSLAQISRSEASRLAEAAEKSKQRRVRAAKNYLSHGALDLSQDDISKLTEYNSYGRDSSKIYT